MFCPWRCDPSWVVVAYWPPCQSSCRERHMLIAVCHQAHSKLQHIMHIDIQFYGQPFLKLNLTVHHSIYEPEWSSATNISMDLLPDTLNCRLRMRRECQERFPRHRLQRKPLVSDPDTHHGTCVTHVPWCMSGFLTRGGGENVLGIPGACATRNLTYLVRGPYATGLMMTSYHWSASPITYPFWE